MSSLNVLVTGGAGFIGSHLADALLAEGHRVRVLDNLDAQVHGDLGGRPPRYLSKELEFVLGDVRDVAAVDRALEGVDAVVHFAAAVGVAQSMYEIRKYTEVNTLGAANLLEAVIGRHRAHIRKMIVASSMSIYGEGRYIDPENGEFVEPEPRAHEQLERGEWEPRVPGTRRPARPVGCDEDKRLEPTAIYSVNKRDHEEMFLCVGRAYGIPAVALRFFNVYGPRQALGNPYTGVGAIFSSCYLNGNAPKIYEDGNMTRDFVHVKDIARANLLALGTDRADYEAINVGTGRATSINQLARLLLERLHPARVDDPDLQPRIIGKFRAGDIRHCYADLEKARRLLGFEPSVPLEEGLNELIDWVRNQAAEDRSDRAHRELETRRLV